MSRANRDRAAEAERFKLMRKALGLTQKDIADAMSRKQSMISAYESGKHIVHPDDLRLLNKKFGVSYEWFYSGTGKMLIHKTNLVTDIATLNNSNEELHIRLLRAEKAIAELQEKYDQLLQKVGN